MAVLVGRSVTHLFDDPHLHPSFCEPLLRLDRLDVYQKSSLTLSLAKQELVFFHRDFHSNELMSIKTRSHADSNPGNRVRGQWRHASSSTFQVCSTSLASAAHQKWHNFWKLLTWLAEKYFRCGMLCNVKDVQCKNDKWSDKRWYNVKYDTNMTWAWYKITGRDRPWWHETAIRRELA